jgi:cellulose/xylan binding protein with CBM9 domain
VISGDLPSWDVPRLGPTDRLVSIGPLRLRRSGDGSAASLPTVARVALRGGDLLVRFDGRDRGVVATLTRRDDPLWKEDVFEVFLSPGTSPCVYYEFEVNPLGALFDARIESPEGRRETMLVDVGWSCPGLSARVKRRPDRWSALLRIPLAPLSATPVAFWRANFYRIDRGPPEEYSAWSPTGADPPDFHLPNRFGLLRLPSAGPASG